MLRAHFGWLVAPFVAVLIGSLAARADAASITVSASVTTSASANTTVGTESLALFDPALGTLTAVTGTYTVLWQDVEATHLVTEDVGFVTLIGDYLAYGFGGFADPGSMVEFGFFPGVSGGELLRMGPYSGTSSAAFSGLDPAAFVGTGFGAWTHQAVFTPITGWDFTGSVRHDVSFTYTFEPSAPAAVPEPATLILLGTGLAAVVLCRRFTTRS